jgi:membrane protein involved in colicin uptake
MNDKRRGRRQDDEGQRDGGDLSGLRQDAADELAQEEAGRVADASASSAANATAARVAFEDQQKDRARSEAQQDLGRAAADENDQARYADLKQAEADAIEQADADARAAGRKTPSEIAAEQEKNREEAPDDGLPDGVDAGEMPERGFPVQDRPED